MAVSLTASNSLTIQLRANAIWSERTAAGTQYSNEVTTIRKLMESQNLRFIPVFDDGGRCIGWKNWWIDLTDHEAQAVYSGTSRDSDNSGCDIDDGATVGTQAVTYTPDVFVDDHFYIDDNLCANDETFVNLSSEGLSHSMLKIRTELNKRAIQWLNTNASANLDTVVVDGVSGITTAGTTTTVPAAALDDQAFLIQLQIMAESNRISDYLILDSTIMLQSNKLAPFLGLNDQQRSFGAIYGDASSRYNYDIRQMASVVGSPVMFLANPNMFGYFNKNKYGMDMQLIDPAAGMYAFKIQDPVLRYRRTEINANGIVTGSTLVPVEYDVLYQKDCQTARDTNGYPVYRHKWEVKHVGGMMLGPTANNDATGILKFELQTGA